MTSQSLAAEKRATPSLNSFPYIKLTVLIILHICAQWLHSSLLNTTMGMNVELSIFTRFSLTLISAKLLLITLIVGSGMMFLNEKKAKDPLEKEKLSQIIFIGLLIIHIAIIFALIHPIFMLVNAQ